MSETEQEGTQGPPEPAAPEPAPEEGGEEEDEESA